jgi:putative ABC transport system permease protein
MSFLRDLRYALRSLGRSRGLTAALLATVAVGIGTHATVGGFINGLLAHNLAIPDAERVAAIYSRDANGRYAPVPRQRYRAVRQASRSFESLAAFRESRGSVTLHGRANWMSVVRATPDIWDVVRIPPALGRTAFVADGDAASAIGIVIAARVWRNEFGGRADAIGAEAAVDGRRARVVGVLPDGFEGLYVGRGIDVWAPLDESDGTGATASALGVIGRLRADASMEDAQAEVTSAAGGEIGTVVLRYSATEPDIQLRLAQVKRLLEWAAALVFLTAAANVAGFLLSRAVRRSHETAARVTLGATSARLASQVLADSLVISVGGGVLGGLVAFWTAAALPAMLFYAEDAERLRLSPDVSQIAAIAASYSVVMLVCALAPILQIGRQGPMEILRRSGGGSVTSITWLRSVLVIGQMCVCVVLVIGTALLFQGFRQALRTVRADRLGEPIVAILDAGGGYARPAAGQDYFRRAEREVAGVPGVVATAWTATLPGGRPSSAGVWLEPPAIGSREVSVDTITPSGRQLLALPLVAGRMFRGGDGPFSCRVAMVNEEMAARYFHGDAAGRSMRDAAGHRVDIVGVVGAPAAKAEDRPEPIVYFYENQALSPPSRDVKSERLTIRLQPGSAPPVMADIDVNVASTRYFDAVGASFVAGRGFAEQGPTDGCDEVVINREAAQRYFDGNALGGAVIDTDGRRAEIVGVVDAGALRVMQRRPDPMVYYPAAARYIPHMILIAGTTHASPQLVAEVARRLTGVAGAAHDPAVLTLDEQTARTSLGPERIATVLAAVCALIALALALLGVYGVMSDLVRQKKRDIALRLALGAQAPTIVAGVVRDGVRIAAAGALTGLGAAWLLVQLLQHQDASLHAPAPWTWLVCPLVLLTIVMVASILPARWALAVDPLTITRDE